MPTQAVPARRKATASRHPAPRKRATEGIVVAIVAVTGTVDDVGDIIQPGIFGPTLAKRRPKVVFHHDMKDFAGRILHIEELLPGDPKLPKRQQNGLPWPAAAGALVATMQFNMNTERGRTVFEWARFYAESNESAWSIGYSVPKGRSVTNRGVRIIQGIELFEVSLVLHGAHPMTMALEVKSAAAYAVQQARSTLEWKSVDGAVAAAHGLAQPDNSGGIMVALYPAPEVAAQLAHPAGAPPEDLHVTLAYLGKVDGAAFTKDDVVNAVRSAAANATPLGGQVGGLGLFPPGDDGAPVWAPVDVSGLSGFRESVVSALESGPTAGAVHRDHGYTPHMTLGYDLDDVSPVAPTPVQFGSASVKFGTERVDIPLGPTGAPPLELKGAALAVHQARTTNPTAMETKMSPEFPGSYEERRDAVRAALIKEMLPKPKKGEPCGWVSVGATFPDAVITTVYKSGIDDEGESFRVPYTFDGDKAKIGTPEPVSLSVVVTGAGGGQVAADTTDLVVAPLTGALRDATAALQVAPIEYKGLAAMRPVLLDLFEALAAKGLNPDDLLLGGDEDDEDEDADLDGVPLIADADLPEWDENEVGDADDLDDAITPEGGPAAAPELEDNDEDEDAPAAPEMVPVDPAQFEAEMAALRV